MTFILRLIVWVEAFFREKNNEVVGPIFAFEKSFISNVGLIKIYSTVELIVTHWKQHASSVLISKMFNSWSSRKNWKTNRDHL